MFGGKVTKQLLDKMQVAYELKNKLRDLKVEN
jgi:hypothetical protein